MKKIISKEILPSEITNTPLDMYDTIIINYEDGSFECIKQLKEDEEINA